MEARFEWDVGKDVANRLKHGVSFETAKRAFEDPAHFVRGNPRHSRLEDRYYCYGKVDDKVLTVRFTYRREIIRIIGAGYWRAGRSLYEKKNPLY